MGSRRRWTVVVSLAVAIALVTGWCFSRPPEWAASAIPRANVLLVTIDTLRADRVTPQVMPFLAGLAARSRSFTRAYTHAPLTLPAHASLLTGLEPHVHGVRGNGTFRLAAAHVTIAERLRDEGYDTGAFLASFVLDARFGLDQGFARYAGVDDSRAFAGDFAYAERPARAVLDEAANWIGAVPPDQPWFAWVHLFEPHAPYEPHAASGLGAAYDGEARRVDEEVQRFMAALESMEPTRPLLALITADHGEGLGERGESTHGLFAYDSTMRVPLIVSGPGLGRGVHDAPVAHIDVVPTLLDVLGLPGGADLPGTSLRTSAGAASTARAIRLEAMDGWLTARAAPLRAVVADGWKFIDVPEAELYDLSSDPGERHNLFDTQRERARTLAARLEEPSGAFEAGVQLLDRSAAMRLRSLGYAGTSAPPGPAPDGSADDPKAVRDVYERFLRALRQGESGLADLLAIVRERPRFASARLSASSLLIEAGRAEEAIPLLADAPHGTASGANPVAERLGVAYLAAGRPADAARTLRAIPAARSSADALNALGVAQAMLGETAAAIATFDEALRIAPAAPRIRINRAMARREAGDHAQAERDLQEALALDPSFADGWRMLGSMAHARGDGPNAIEAWRRVVTLAPGDLDTMFNLAATLRGLGRDAEAAEWAARFAAAADPRTRRSDLDALASLLKR